MQFVGPRRGSADLLPSNAPRPDRPQSDEPGRKGPGSPGEFCRARGKIQFREPHTGGHRPGQGALPPQWGSHMDHPETRPELRPSSSREEPKENARRDAPARCAKARTRPSPVPATARRHLQAGDAGKPRRIEDRIGSLPGEPGGIAPKGFAFGLPGPGRTAPAAPPEPAIRAAGGTARTAAAAGSGGGPGRRPWREGSRMASSKI